MDPLTQGMFGALWAQAARPGRDRRLAALAGALAGMAPDLDVLIRSSSDPLLAVEYHRHFTHSLLFAPLGALLVALVLRPLLAREIPLRRWYLWCLLGFASHGVLDAFTSYGTRLLWPMDDVRYAWHAVSVVDPLFSLPLAVLLFLSLRRQQAHWMVAAAVWVSVFLGVGLIQQQRAESAVERWAAEQGLPAQRVVAKPAFASIVLWRGLIDTGEQFHLVAVRNIPGTRTHLWPQGAVQALRWDRLPPASRLALDIERFAHFSDHWLFRYADYEVSGDWFIGDFRYALEPGSQRPLWGLRAIADAPTRPPRFERLSRVDLNERKNYLARLRGTVSGEEVVLE